MPATSFETRVTKFLDARDVRYRLLPHRNPIFTVADGARERGVSEREMVKCILLREKKVHRFVLACAAGIARRMGRLLGWQADYSGALTWMARGLGYLSDPPAAEERPAAAMLHIHTGSLYYLMGQYEQAAAACRRGLALLEGTQHPHQLAEGNNLLGVINDTRGRTDDALDYYRQSIAHWDTVGDAYNRTRVEENMAAVYFYRGNLPQARDVCLRVLAFWQKIGHRYGIAHSHMNLGSIYLQQGAWDEANRHFEAALSGWREGDDLRWLGQLHTNLGSLNVALEDWDRAQHHLERSREILEANDIRDILAETHRWRAELACGQGNAQQALTHAQRGLSLAQELDIGLEIGANQRVLGKAHRLAGNTEQAEHHLQQSLARLEPPGYRYELGRTHHELARLFNAAGNRAGFKTHRAAAAEIFTALGAQKDLERVEGLV